MINTILKRNFITIIQNGNVGVRTNFGKFNIKKGLVKPGIRLNIPFYHNLKIINIKEIIQDIKRQSLISKDNVTFNVDGFVQYKIINPEMATFNVTDIHSSVNEISKIALRNELSCVEINEILENRKKLNTQMINSLKKEEDNWGIKFIKIELRDISFDESMKRSMSIKAEADRNAMAKIINAEADVQTAKKYQEAAKIYKENPISLRLREFQLWNSVSKNNSNSLFVIPSNLLDFMNKKK